MELIDSINLHIETENFYISQLHKANFASERLEQFHWLLFIYSSQSQHNNQSQWMQTMAKPMGSAAGKSFGFQKLFVTRFLSFFVHIEFHYVWLFLSFINNFPINSADVAQDERNNYVEIIDILKIGNTPAFLFALTEIAWHAFCLQNQQFI